MAKYEMRCYEFLVRFQYHEGGKWYEHNHFFTATSLANARKQLKKGGYIEIELLSKWAEHEEPQTVTRTSIRQKNAWTKQGDDVTRRMK